MSGKTKYRCAIYTRKSTEEGLEQDFNSLDAQREACEAYITSQRHEGWHLVKTHYDDGGISGGTMDRPGLQKLLTHIKQSKIDIVVVYKIDRLTRALMDFAKMVEIFDAHKVSFVSVTQQFNTTTSMGRLTLNVLLSFAQFEREVTAERIRDKIAASKKKGMWMGGMVPLGYDAQNKKLVINKREAQIVTRLFELYLQTKSVRQLKEEADRLGLVTKHRLLKNGVTQGAKPFSRGHLYDLLSNPIYIGKVVHHGEVFEGQHERIIDQETWDAVQGLMANNAVCRKTSDNVMDPSLLQGLVFDETGDRLSPSHAIKNSKRYRYYISHRLMQARRQAGDGWRLPAHELEIAALKCLIRFFKDHTQLIDVLRLEEQSIQSQRLAFEKAGEVIKRIENNMPTEQRRLVESLIQRVCITPGKLELAINIPNLVKKLLGDKTNALTLTQSELCIDAPFSIKSRGVEEKLIIGERPKAKPDAGLIALLAKAHYRLHHLTSGKTNSIGDLAEAENEHRNEISRTLPLTYLAPDIVKAILAGTQPAGLTASRLKRFPALPLDWVQQRRVLDFQAKA